MNNLNYLCGSLKNMLTPVRGQVPDMSEGQVPDSYKRSMSRGIGLFFVSQNSTFIFFLFHQKDVLPCRGPTTLVLLHKKDLKPLPKPLAILARGLQPLLLVALSLRYAWASEPWRDCFIGALRFWR